MGPKPPRTLTKDSPNSILQLTGALCILLQWKWLRVERVEAKKKWKKRQEEKTKSFTVSNGSTNNSDHSTLVVLVEAAIEQSHAADLEEYLEESINPGQYKEKDYAFEASKVSAMSKMTIAILLPLSTDYLLTQ